jgi:cytochrome c5
VIKQKRFVFGFAILLAVSLFLIGCTTPKTEITTTSTTVSSFTPKSTKTTETTTTSTTVSSSTTASSSTEVSSVSEGKNLVEKKCTVCHNTQRIYLKKRDAAEWETIVDKMIGKGAVVSNADRTKIIEYLASLNQ